MKIKLLLFAFILVSFSFSLLPESYSGILDKEDLKGTYAAGVWEVEPEISEPKPSDLEPGVLLYSNPAKNKVGFVIANVAIYDEISFNLTYFHNTEFGKVQEVVKGTIDNTSHLPTISNEWILLGSCSSGGTCFYYEGVEKVDISVDLIISGTVQQSINDALVF